MFDLELNWPVPANGVEVVGAPGYGPGRRPRRQFRAKGGVMRPATRRIVPTDYLAVRFANIVIGPIGLDEKRAANFLRSAGFTRFDPQTRTPATEVDAEVLRIEAAGWRGIIERATNEPAKAMRDVDEMLIQALDAPYRMSLDVELAPRESKQAKTGRPRITLRPKSLIEFMALEVAEIACTEGTGFRSCLYCGDCFITGPSTGRRATSKFCRDLHRVYYAQHRPGGI